MRIVLMGWWLEFSSQVIGLPKGSLLERLGEYVARQLNKQMPSRFAFIFVLMRILYITI